MPNYYDEWKNGFILYFFLTTLENYAVYDARRELLKIKVYNILKDE